MLPPSAVLGVLGSAASDDPPGTCRRLRVEGALVFFDRLRHEDERGFFEEVSFSDIVGVQTAEAPLVRQSGYSCSQRNVLRGIHCSPYGKLVICQSGEMWDAVVDLRPDSPTFLEWDAVLLSPERRTRMYVPPGVGHGFLALKDDTTCLYLKLGCYDRSQELEVNAFDPAVGIRWPLPVGSAEGYVISAKDRSLPPAAEALRQRRLSEEEEPRGRGRAASNSAAAAAAGGSEASRSRL